VLQKFSHLLHRTKKIEFIEQFSEKMLVKQEGEDLQIVDVHSSSIILVPETKPNPNPNPNPDPDPYPNPNPNPDPGPNPDPNPSPSPNKFTTPSFLLLTVTSA
jgi:hypothetical protein